MKGTVKRIFAIFTISLMVNAIDFKYNAKANEEISTESAASMLEEGDYSKAFEIYDTLIDQGIDTAEVHYGRARTLQELGENKQSLESYTKSIELDPKNAKAYSK